MALFIRCNRHRRRAITAWLTRRIWRARERKCWCSNGGMCWAVRPARKRLCRDSNFPSALTFVSLLRPEIIRDLDLPRHGLEILPLDGTFTPMPSGDYLWRVNDHGKTHREIARHSRVDAEAYDEFGKAMQAMCRFVKPILSMAPPDPDDTESARTDEAVVHRTTLSGNVELRQI